MNTSIKPSAGEKFPSLSWQQTDGTCLAPAEMSGWRMLVVYRGAHCPLRKSYLRTLEELQSAIMKSMASTTKDLPVSDAPYRTLRPGPDLTQTCAKPSAAACTAAN